MPKSLLQASRSNPHRQIRVAMAGALFLVGLIAIFGMEIQARSLRSAKSEVEIMNLTGRQRMLCQRLSRMVALIMVDEVSQNEKFRKNLRLDVAELNGNADRIYFLMDEQIRSGANLQDVRKVFSDARDHRDALVKTIHDFDESDSEHESSRNSFAAEAQITSDSFLVKIEQAVSALQSFCENRVNSHILQIYTLAGVMLLAIAFVALCIVAPAVQVLRRQNANALHLRAEMALLASVAQLTTNAVVVTDANRKIIWVNEGFTRITGYTFDDAIGTNPGQLLQSANTDRNTIDAIRNALKSQQSFQGTILNRSKFGREYWPDLDIQPQRDLLGNLTGFIAIESDVTSQKFERDRLKSTFEAVGAGIVELNELNGIVDCNPAAERILGFSLEQMYGRKPLDPLWCAIKEDGSTFPGVDHPASITLRTGVPIADVVLGIQTPDGVRRWISVSTSPIFNCHGTVASVISSFVDVTVRFEDLHRFESIVQSARVGTWDWNVPTGRLNLNDEWASMLGYELSDLEPNISTWERLLKPSELERVWTAINHHFSGVTDAINCEIPLRHEDGTFIWVLLSGKVTEWLADGTPQRVLGVHVNISAQKSYEEALQKAKADAESALRETKATRMVLDVHSLLSVTNSDGVILEANKGFCRVSGYSEAELIGNDHRIMNSGAHPKSFWIDVWKTISSGEAWHGEVCNRRKDGALYWVDSTFVPYLGSDGKIEKYVSIRFDITAQKAAEGALVAAQFLANTANIAKSEFLANMSHEIRTPMTAILGFTDLLEVELRESNCSSECIEYIDIIDRNGEHLLQIINDILDLSKIEAGKMTIENVEVNTGQLIHDVLSLMDVRAKSKGLTLEAVIDTDIPFAIETDPVRLRQILVNLVGNAIKFTELGGVTIRIRYDPSNRMMRFDVIDTGIGMTPSQAGKVFQAFVQADASTTRKFGGTGLGLQISKRLAEVLGGNISLESQFAIGSKFSVTILVGVQSDAQMIKRNSEVSSKGKLSFLPSFDNIEQPQTAALKLEGMRIILAEDGPDNQRLLGHILRKAGALVTIVENGKLAVECLTVDGTQDGELLVPSNCDLLLTDMQMPIMDGYEATAYLRKKGSTLPIVALTANVMSHDVLKCLQAGCDDYASKPIDKNLLIGICEKWWRASLESEESIVDLRKSTVELADLRNKTDSPPTLDSVVSIQI